MPRAIAPRFEGPASGCDLACSTTQQQVASSSLRWGVIARRDGIGHCGPPPAHRHQGGVGLLQVQAATRLGGMFAQPCHHARSAQARGRSGWIGGHWGQGSAAVAQRRRSSLGRPGSGRQSGSGAATLLASRAPPAHFSTQRRCSRHMAPGPASSSLGRGPEKSSSAASPGQQRQVSQASTVPAADCGEPLSGARAPCGRPPEQAAGSPTTGGVGACVEIGGARQAAHQEG